MTKLVGKCAAQVQTRDLLVRTTSNNIASDSSLESQSPAKLISIKFLGFQARLGGGDWRHYPVLSVSVGSGEGWHSNVAQISMKTCRNKGSDNAIESPSPTKLVSIKFFGVLWHLGGGADVTTRSYLRLWVGSGIQTWFRSQSKTAESKAAIAH